MAAKKQINNDKNTNSQGHDELIHDPIFVEHLLEGTNKSTVVVVNAKGICVYANRRTEQILQIPIKEILQQQVFKAIPLINMEGKEIHERKHPVFLALQKEPYVQVTPFFCKLNIDGNNDPLALNVTQIKKGKSVVGAVVQIRKAERELNVGEMKSLFLSFAAHQLKTPSSIVKGFLELMMREGHRSYNPDQWNFLTSAYESNEHLIHVSRTLLGLARLEGGLIAPQIRQFDPILAIENKVKTMGSLLDLKEMELVVGSRGQGYAYSDDNFFLEIFEILLANAIKHSPNGTKINIFCKVNKDGVEVRVIDNGPGISDEMKTKLFAAPQPGSTENNSHGLGLYMAKKYIALLSGNIGVKDRVDKQGSDFYFFIPNH